MPSNSKSSSKGLFSRQFVLSAATWILPAVFVFFALYLHDKNALASALVLGIAVLIHLFGHRKLIDRRIGTQAAQLNDLIEMVRKEIATETQLVRKEIATETKQNQKKLELKMTRKNKSLERAASTEAHEVASAISNLVNVIKPSTPLIFERSWMASPRFLLSLYQEIREKKPQLVLDLGSGMTTLIASYAVRDNGFGSVVAWEHDASFAEKTEELVGAHSLSHLSSIEHRDLIPINLDGKEFLWFDTRNMTQKLIDLLIVDSPPGSTGPLARFPAVPVLKEHLAKSATIFLDDINREDEAKTLQIWKELLPNSDTFLSPPKNKGQFAIIRPRN